MARLVKSDASHPAARKAAPNATEKTALPATLAKIVDALPASAQGAPVKIRGPHIAKVELLPPGEQYD